MREGPMKFPFWQGLALWTMASSATVIAAALRWPVAESFSSFLMVEMASGAVLMGAGAWATFR